MCAGRFPSDPPSENTLTINVTHEILDQIEPIFNEAVVFSPSRAEEGDLGYDISFDWAKLFVLQYKQYKPQLTGKILHNGSLSNKEFLKYEVDEDQHLTLRSQYPSRGLAFFAIPIATKRSQLPGILPWTLFIDVYDVPIGATRISIPKKHELTYNPSKSCTILDLSTPIYYCKDGEHHTIDRFRRWGDLYMQLVLCSSGILMMEDGYETMMLEELTPDTQEIYRENTGLRNVSKIVFGGDNLPKNVPWESGDFEWDERTKGI